MMHRPWTALCRATGVSALGVLLVVGVAGPASAHVTITTSTTRAGATAVLTVGVPHGCGESPTTRMDILLPEGVGGVEASPDPRWDVVGPTPGEGSSSVLSFVAVAPLPDAAQDTVEFSVVLPDSTGATLAFPTIQRCEDGEAAWTEVPAGQQAVETLQMPAPSFVLTQGSTTASAPSAAVVPTPPDPSVDASPTTGQTPPATDLPPAAEADPVEAATDPTGPPSVYLLGGVAVLGTAGAAAVVLSRRRIRP